MALDGKLNGKVVLITGANGGLGKSVTNAFLNAGAKVIGVSQAIADTEFPNANFRAVSAELSSLSAARAAVSAAGDQIDVLVHLVGGFAGGKSIAETDEQTFHRMLDMNLLSAFYMISAVLPGMRGRGAGRILAIGSKNAVEPSPMAGAYAVSKAALVSLIRTVARENKDKDITANVLLPGTMDTPANRAADPKADFSRWVDPRQVAAMLVHLASDQASQINGAVIPILHDEA